MFAAMRAAINNLLDYDIPRLRHRQENGLGTVGNSLSGGTVSNTQNGKFRIAAQMGFRVGGNWYSKAGSLTAAVWDLSAEAAVGAASWRGYRLQMTSGGTASFTSTADTSSAALALASLDYLAIESDKSIIADFAAAPSTSFSADSLSGVSGAVLYQGAAPLYLRSYAVRW